MYDKNKYKIKIDMQIYEYRNNLASIYGHMNILQNANLDIHDVLWMCPWPAMHMRTAHFLISAPKQSLETTFQTNFILSFIQISQNTSGNKYL